VGTIRQSVITTSGECGRFASDGLGSHDVTITDSVAKQNNLDFGLTRNCGGTTTATRFDTDQQVAAWKGSLNRTTGANLVLNMSFLNDARWKKEMCTDAGVSRGFCATSMNLGDYISNQLGVVPAAAPAAPTRLRVR